MSLFTTATELLQNPEIRQTTDLFCTLLDSTIGQCLRPGHVVEVAGEAGTGKTQLALQLSLCASVPRNASQVKNQGVVVYISAEGEGPFPSSRLKEMIDESRFPAFQRSAIMDRIIVEKVQDVDQLFMVLNTRLDLLYKKYRINLIILDSIAGPLRTDNESVDRRARSALIHKLGYDLNMAARKFKAPIVVINQVSAFIDQAQESFGRSVVPCFGLAFATYVHTRIFLERSDVIIQPDPNAVDKEVLRLRTASVDFSPLLPPQKINFVVQRSGVQGVNINDET